MLTKPSNYKLEFTLKQHTPIIHFQANQAGATLRATELKPKLDRFLIEHVFKNDKSKYEKYLIKGQQKAFDYKVRVASKKEVINENITKKLGAFFGDSKSLNLSKIKLEITVLNKELKNLINLNIEQFFVIESFGTRNNKGFGNFTLEKTTKEQFESLLQKRFTTVYKKELNKNQKPLQTIQREHQLLKSGINFTNNKTGISIYKKSLLFNYFCNKKIRWEKRKIKRELINNQSYSQKYPLYYDTNKEQDYDKFPDYADPINCPDNNKNEEFRYIRALLGLAEQYEYLLDYKGSPNKYKKLVIGIRDSKGEIERFKSPLLYKVFENTIYIIPLTIDNKIFNKKFSFDLKIKEKVNNKWKEARLIKKDFIAPIKTPTKEEFNLQEFLSSYLNNYQRI